MKTELLKFKPSDTVLKKCERFIEIFKEYNSHTNLMSKNDLGVIFEKHIMDSLALVKFDGFKTAQKILDIGTGGGFPAIPLSIFFQDKKIFAVDSIQKKIRFLEEAKKELNLTNLTPICSRIEKLDLKDDFDIITSRALSDLSQIIKYSLPYLKKGGVIVAYKSKSFEEELKKADNLIKKYHLSPSKPIFYKLECNEMFERCLVFLKKV